MRLPIEENLQAVLRPAQKAVGIVEDVIFLVVEAAGFLERLHRQEGIALAHLGQVVAVGELEKLDRELDIANAAVAGLHIGVGRAALGGLLLDAALEDLDFVDLGKAQIFAIYVRLDGGHEGMAEFDIAGHWTNLDEGLPLPGPAERVVV